MSTMDSPLLAADPLPLEVAERLLAVTIHLLPRRPGHRGPSAWSTGTTDKSTNPLHTLMCVLGPRQQYPDITTAALARCWWVDLDFASGVAGDVELLKIMDRLAHTTDDRMLLQRRPLQWTHAAMDQASKKGFVHVLDWWYVRFGAACWYTGEALEGAAEAGHLNALKWWADRKDALSCELNNKILLHAVLGGHTDICTWWLALHRIDGNPSDAYRVPIMDGLVYALIHAIRCNDSEFRMFHWWMAQPFCHAPKARHLKRVHNKELESLPVAIWTHREKSAEVIARIPELIDAVDLSLPVQTIAGMFAGALTTNSAIKWLEAHASRVWEAFVDMSAMASWAGRVHVLDWIARHPMLDKVNQGQLEAIACASMSSASGAGHVHVLDWWMSACPWLDKVRDAVASDTRAAVLEAGHSGHVHVLEWWKQQSGLAYKCDQFMLQTAAQTGQVLVLDWWVRSGQISESELDLWMKEVIRAASIYNHPHVLDWWSHQQQFSKNNSAMMNAIAAASSAGSIDALDWWASTCWFSDWLERGNAMFSLDLPRPQTFDWWIEHMGADPSRSPDTDRHAKFHRYLFLALAQSPSTVLLHKYVRQFGFPEIASKSVQGEPHLADQVGMKALQAGHVCTYGWWLDSRLRKPDPVIVETHAPRSARHVKAWLKAREEYKRVAAEWK